MIGALVQDVSNSFSGSLLRSLEGAARSRDMVIVASSLDEEPERERYLVESLLRRRVDGLLLMPATQRQDYLVEAVYGRLPVVFVDRRPQGVDVDSVTVDNTHGARLAVEHLMAHGHERIAILGDRVEIQTARDRLDGFMQAMRAAGLEPPAAHVAMSMRSEEEATDAVYRMLDSGQRPTAFFAARNSLTMGAIRALRQRGFEREVAVVGFDDFPMADMVDPPVTVIRQDLGQIGAETTRLLFARIDGADGPPERIVLMPELVPRGSGEIRP
jgi:LacI family transcriptional regulator